MTALKIIRKQPRKPSIWKLLATSWLAVSWLVPETVSTKPETHLCQ